MKLWLIAVFAASSLHLSATVTTEVYYRLGEDGVRAMLLAVDSSGHRRDSQAWALGAATMATNSPPPGIPSSIYYHFSGASGYYAFAGTTYTPPSNNCGCEFWARTDQLSQLQKHVGGTGSGDNGISVGFDAASGGFVGRAGSTQFGTPYMPASNEWVHLAVVQESGVTTFYVNGVASGTSSVNPQAPQGWNFALAYCNNQWFVGDIDELRVFSFAPGQFSRSDLLVYAVTNAPTLLGTMRSSQNYEGPQTWVEEGENVTFTPTLWGNPPISCFWYGATDLLSTNAIFTISNVTASASYYLVASNAVGVVTSAVESVALRELLTPPQSQTPNAAQQDLIDRKYGMFLHFGMETFFSSDFVNPPPPAATWQPTGMDPDQWVATAWHAGLRYVVLTVKHHPGFCLWPSQYTSYCVTNPACGNHEDVVGLTAAACRKYGLSFGMYYSLWDLYEPTFRTNFWPGYHTYVTNQLTELLTRYGPICEIWLDGAWGERRVPMDWHMAEIYDCAKRLQPNCAIAVNYGIANPTNMSDATAPDDMTNGCPIIYFPYDVRTCDPQPPSAHDPKLYSNPNIPGSLYYMPYEAPYTVQASLPNCWFWNGNDTNQVTVDNLAGFYSRATMNSNAVLVNVPPTTAGVLTEAHSNLVVQAAIVLGLTPFMSHNADTDGDGMSNWDEWVAGTDPTDPLSVFRMLPPTNTANGLLLTWTSVTNRTYSMEQATDLSGSPAFSILQGNLAGQPGVTTYTVSNSVGAGPVFYRVGVHQ